MIVVRRFCLLLSLVVVGWLLPVSCAHQQRIKNETGPIAEALRFREQDRFGNPRSLGGKQNSPTSGVQVPAPGLVDIDSLIEIGIDKSQLVTGQPPLLDQAQAERMQTEHEWLQELVARFESLTVLLDPYRRPTRTACQLLISPPLLIEPCCWIRYKLTAVLGPLRRLLLALNRQKDLF